MRMNDDLSHEEEEGGIEIQTRLTPGHEYIKLVVISSWRIIDAITAGDCDLEETIEEFVQSGFNVNMLGFDLLDPSMDASELFD